MLRAASEQARAELAEQLADASGDTAAIGEELFGVATLLRHEAAIRRVVTDASIEADAKAGLVGDLFGDAVGIGHPRPAPGRRTSPLDGGP